MKNSSQDSNSRLPCGHHNGTICRECAQKEIDSILFRLSDLLTNYKNLEKKLDLMLSENKKPLCWSCKNGTCIQISRSVISNKDENEEWRENSTSRKYASWLILCNTGNPGDAARGVKFETTEVLQCNCYSFREDL